MDQRRDEGRMILDSGICTIFKPFDVSYGGVMPDIRYLYHNQYWYGERSFSTAPQWRTEGREELRIDAAIRIFQDRSIAQYDIVVLRQVSDWDEVITGGDTVYRIVRAYHGVDDYRPDLITDLSLEVYKP